MGEPLVIVGNGMVAARLVERLTDRALGRYDIAVIGAEPHPAYNRVLLSSLLAGEVEEGDLTLKPSLWWRRKGVTTVFGRSVDTVDTAGHTVSLSDGTILPFAKLVFTTGSQPIRLPKPGMDLPGVITFRDLADIATLRALGDKGGKGRGAAAVIGGGLLGIEAAYGLARAGVRVTLIHLMDRLMERQLDAPAAALLRRAIESEGVEVVLCADTARVIGEGRAEGLELTDGRVIPADLVVCAVGIRANAALAKSAGVARQSRHRRRRRLGDVAPGRFTRSANAPSTAASATDWSSPATSRRTCSPRGSRATPMRPIRVRCSPPI